MNYILEIGLVDSYFYELKQNMEEIESKLNINEEIIWQERDKTERQSIARIFVRKSVDLEDESQWDNYIEWQLETMIEFIEAFGPYIDRLPVVQIRIGEFIKQHLEKN